MLPGSMTKSGILYGINMEIGGQRAGSIRSPYTTVKAWRVAGRSATWVHQQHPSISETRATSSPATIRRTTSSLEDHRRGGVVAKMKPQSGKGEMNEPAWKNDLTNYSSRLAMLGYNSGPALRGSKAVS